MDSPTIRCLRGEWLAIGTTPQSAAARHRLAQCEPVVADLGVENLAELVAALSPSSLRLTRNDAAGVIAAMVRGAQIDPLIPRAVVQALIPGVLILSRRFDLAEGPWCDLDAFHADAVSALWELTTSWSCTHRPYAAGDLLSGVRTRLRTLQSNERRHRSRQSASPAGLDALPASIGWWPDMGPRELEPNRPGTSRADPSGSPAGDRTSRLSGPWSRTDVPESQSRQESGRTTLPDDTETGHDSAGKKIPPRPGATP
jgi:hypothetical protein